MIIIFLKVALKRFESGKIFLLHNFRNLWLKITDCLDINSNSIDFCRADYKKIVEVNKEMVVKSWLQTICKTIIKLLNRRNFFFQIRKQLQVRRVKDLHQRKLDTHQKVHLNQVYSRVVWKTLMWFILNMNVFFCYVKLMDVNK